MNHPGKASALVPGNGKDQADVPSLKSSIALSVMRQQYQTRPHVSPLPTLATFSSSNDDEHSSASSDEISAFPREDEHHQQQGTTTTRNDADMIIDDDEGGIGGSAHTYYHEQEESESDYDFSKLMTLQSIDRLENHLPRIVVEHIIADMTQRKEDLAEKSKGNLCPLGGSLTLEVPVGALPAHYESGRRNKNSSNQSDSAAQPGKNTTSSASDAATETTTAATAACCGSVCQSSFAQCHCYLAAFLPSYE